MGVIDDAPARKPRGPRRGQAPQEQDGLPGASVSWRSSARRQAGLLHWLFQWGVLILMFGKELAKSVHDVVLNVVTPGRVTESAIVEIPLEVESDLGIALLANMVTLTPGTTTLHVSDDRKRMYAHVMNYSDTVVDDIKHGFEHQILKVLR